MTKYSIKIIFTNGTQLVHKCKNEEHFQEMVNLIYNCSIDKSLYIFDNYIIPVKNVSYFKLIKEETKGEENNDKDK